MIVCSETRVVGEGKLGGEGTGTMIAGGWEDWAGCAAPDCR